MSKLTWNIKNTNHSTTHRVVFFFPVLFYYFCIGGVFVNIYENKKLNNYRTNILKSIQNDKYRNFVRCIINYLCSETKQILAISGLSGSGKTTAIMQLAQEYDMLYLLSDENDNADGYINIIDNTVKRVVVIDDYTKIKDRKNLNDYLINATKEKRIIIIADAFLEDIKGTHNIHVSMITIDEYLKINNKKYSEKICNDYLLSGNVFNEINSYAEAEKYIDKAIVIPFMKYENVSYDKALALTYSVLYKAVSSIINISLKDFLEKMDILHIPDNKDIEKTTEIFTNKGITARIRNYTSDEERIYFVNTALIYWIIKKVCDIDIHSILTYLFYSSVAFRLYENMLLEHILYYDTNNILIISDKEGDWAYIIKCAYDNKVNNTSLTKYENELEIIGKYVIYTGNAYVNEDIIYIPMCSMLDFYFTYEHNLQSIQKTKN